MEPRQANKFTVKEIPELTDIFHYSEPNGHRVRMSWAKFNEYIDGRVAPAYSRANHTGSQAASTISDFNAAADARVAPAYARANHTGTQLAATISDFNAAADLRVAPAFSRANHTGSQLANTISDFSAAVDALVSPAYSPIGHTHTLANITDAGTAAGYNVGTASGQIPVLGAGGKLSNSVIPPLAIKEYLLNHADLATALADAGVQAGERGDWFTIDDGGGLTYIITTDNPTLSGHVTVLKTPTGGVSSVNGDTGVVTLDSDDIGEGVTNLYYTNARVDTRINELSIARLNINQSVDQDKVWTWLSSASDAITVNPSTGKITVGTTEYRKGYTSVSAGQSYAWWQGASIRLLMNTDGSFDFNASAINGIGGMNFNSTGDPELLVNTSKVDGRAEVSFENDARKYTWRLSSDDAFELYDRTAIARRLRLNTDGTFDFENNTIKKARVEPNVQTIASAATVTPDGNIDDSIEVTALATNLTINAPTGTPVKTQPLLFMIKDDGTSRTLTWNAIYNDLTGLLPTSTTVSKLMYVSCVYDATASKWNVIGVVTEP